jgi:hypothetical protein
VNNPTLFHCYSSKTNCATTFFNQHDSAFPMPYWHSGAASLTISRHDSLQPTQHVVVFVHNRKVLGSATKMRKTHPPF